MTIEIKQRRNCGIKYGGINSQFSKMAAKMLGIKTEWA